MSESSSDKNFDIASFILNGNLMIKLIEKGIIDMHDANDIMKRSREAYKYRDLFKGEHIDYDADEYIELLFNKLWDSRPKPSGSPQ